jgi:hypothetical protein
MAQLDARKSELSTHPTAPLDWFATPPEMVPVDAAPVEPMLMSGGGVPKHFWIR